MIVDRGPVSRIWTPLSGPLCQMNRIAAIAFTGLLLCLACLPALAHDDDEKVAPPTPEAQAAAGRMTIGVLSLITGGAVYYAMQRHRVMNGDKHPPEWDKKMGRNAILFAVLSAILVWGVSSALSRPAPVRKPTNADAGARSAVARLHRPPGPIRLASRKGPSAL